MLNPIKASTKIKLKMFKELLKDKCGLARECEVPGGLQTEEGSHPLVGFSSEHL